MPVPTITTAVELKQVARGVAFSWQLEASGVPTSWNATGLPSGLSINAAGLVAGTTVMGSGVYAVSFVATNGSGDSEVYETFLWVVATPAGAIPDKVVVEVDLNLLTKQVRVPGVSEWQPPLVSPAEGAENGPAVLRLSPGENFEIALGALKNEILQALSVSSVIVKAYSLAEQRTYTFSAGGAFAIVGAGDTTRFQTALTVPASVFGRLVADRDGEGQSVSRLKMDFELRLANPANDFSDDDSSAIASLKESDTENATISINLADTVSQAYYDLTFSLLCPSDTGIQASFTRRVSVGYNGVSEEYEVTEVSGPTSATAASAVTGGIWIPTIQIVSITGTATGIEAAIRTTTTKQKRLILPQENDTNDGSTISSPGTPDEWAIKNSEGATIFTLSPGDGASAASIAASFLSGAGEVVSVTLDGGDNEIEIDLPTDTAIVSFEHASSTTGGVTSAGPTKNDASMKLEVAGVEDDSSGTVYKSRMFDVELAAGAA